MNGFDFPVFPSPRAEARAAGPGAGAGVHGRRPPAGAELDQAFRAVSVEDAVFFELDLGGARGGDGPLPASPRPPSDATVVLQVYVVVTGSCRASVAGEPPIALEAGDVLLLSEAAPSIDATGGRAEVIGGRIACTAAVLEPLLQRLPKLIQLRRAPDARFELLARLALSESRARSAGGACALSRLSELFVIDVVRRHWAASPPTDGVWLGLRHDSLRRVLAQIHDRPAHDWSLDELARAGGMSRSVLAERFAEALGVPPMQYISRRRIQIAAGLLASTSLSLAEIATRVGYGSETALSRAYKRCVGVPPAEWRREKRARPELRPLA
jgi:AraC-like DNA-binding protein